MFTDDECPPRKLRFLNHPKLAWVVYNGLSQSLWVVLRAEPRVARIYENVIPEAFDRLAWLPPGEMLSFIEGALACHFKRRLGMNQEGWMWAETLDLCPAAG